MKTLQISINLFHLNTAMNILIVLSVYSVSVSWELTMFTYILTMYYVFFLSFTLLVFTLKVGLHPHEFICS